MLNEFWIAEGPADDRGRVLAGALWSAFRIKRGGKTWLRLPGSCSGLLEEFGICFEEESGIAGLRWVFCSPFWAAALLRLMPLGLGVDVIKPAQCPLLPATFFRAFLGGGRWCRKGVCSGVVPFAPSLRRLQEMGFGTKSLRGLALSRFGLASVHPLFRSELGAVAAMKCGACTSAGPLPPGFPDLFAGP